MLHGDIGVASEHDFFATPKVVHSHSHHGVNIDCVIVSAIVESPRLWHTFATRAVEYRPYQIVCIHRGHVLLCSLSDVR